ncbi:Fe-S cluster assembly ATPase SufC [Konateibacter massiliensis]|uniref:Fe-S cluster assembly ATPase SufC n=1 Tax=Konateibacter massiliensis TaxID=2002841 RepID=UPI000C155FC1|nr:Fe-S cluster assembly ATPase SufC [Konateibacter massiliensis]
MQKNLLDIQDLKASVEGKQILNGVNLTIHPGEVHVLMGPNGAGKSTLANVIMGDPRFAVEGGSLLFEGEDISDEKPDVRARKGIFLSFQAPEEIQGVTLENFLRASRAACSGKPVKIFAFKDELKKNMEELGMDAAYAKRYLNVGFSGGEKKKSEILQMAMMNPKLAILDETDSGLDVDAVKLISENIARFKSENNAMLIITHITKILQDLPVDYVHILADGKIVQTGDASLVETVIQEGFSSVLK